ncbi:MAG: mobile mystery protein B [Phenylobacterium sp.]|uniref:mobile mystery protein B n=1 Tax=Phenylobacterium sp. TaxID=1871053 RepID=UPI0027311D44|nr:mobile mystery protein B [Phenylobacterium sp.]MDP2012303.1 mobile mystery protein B [Phenylobacterium sp.]MDP3866787.1 mobile mystery protein B [Phenylobacterium sp.]
MIDPLIDAEDDASTPLDPEERHDLIPSYITNRDELNEIEQLGIAEADRWAFSRKRDALDERFLLQLHRTMFHAVWKWAGAFRVTERNIGVPAYMIAVELRRLLDDVGYWIEHETFPRDEIALRFHAQLTWIHPFPNGNGRHARLAADLLSVQLGGDRFSWGGGSLIAADQLRKRYIAAVRAADNHDIGPLLDFARS